MSKGYLNNIDIVEVVVYIRNDLDSKFKIIELYLQEPKGFISLKGYFQVVLLPLSRILLHEN